MSAESDLIRFACMTLGAHREECTDLDGAFLQETAEACGLLERIPVIEPCGEFCFCAEWDNFPQECLRIKPEVLAIMGAQES